MDEIISETVGKIVLVKHKLGFVSGAHAQRIQECNEEVLDEILKDYARKVVAQFMFKNQVCNAQQIDINSHIHMKAVELGINYFPKN